MVIGPGVAGYHRLETVPSPLTSALPLRCSPWDSFHVCTNQWCISLCVWRVYKEWIVLDHVFKQYRYSTRMFVGTRIGGRDHDELDKPYGGPHIPVPRSTGHLTPERGFTWLLEDWHPGLARRTEFQSTDNQWPGDTLGRNSAGGWYRACEPSVTILSKFGRSRRRQIRAGLS